MNSRIAGATPLTFFAPPLPGELLYSVVARNHYLGANIDGRATLASFFGTPAVYLRGEFPARLHLFCERTGIPIDTLLRENTTLNFFRPFTDPAHFEKAAMMMASSSTQNITNLLGIQAGLLHFPNLQRQCPRCAVEDRAQFGFAYLHTEHHLPGVYVCARHGCVLAASRFPRRRLVINEGGSPMAPEELSAPLLRISRWCVDGFRASQFIDTQRRIAACRHALAARGLLTPSRRVRSKSLCLALKNHWGDLLTLEPFSIFSEWMERNQFSRSLLYKTTQQFHPIKHILLLDFLFGSWSALIDTLNKAESAVTAASTPRLLPPNNKAERDSEIVALLRLHKGVISKAAAEAHISFQTVRAIAMRHRVAFSSSPKIINTAMSRKIWRYLFLGWDVERIAQMHGIGVGSVKQLLTGEINLVKHREHLRREKSRLQHRRVWEMHINRHPQASRMILHTLEPAVYAWLYRNDHEWLLQHLPVCIPAQRPKRDKIKNNDRGP